MMDRTGDQDFRLDGWQICPRRNVLRHGRHVRHVEPKVMDVLMALALREGETVLRSELLAEVWPGLHVVDGALGRAIYQLRKAFADGGAPDMIETVRGRGYRLTCPVQKPEQRRPFMRHAAWPRLRDMVAAAALLVAFFLSTGVMSHGIPMGQSGLVATHGGPAIADEPMRLAAQGPEGADSALPQDRDTDLLTAPQPDPAPPPPAAPAAPAAPPPPPAPAPEPAPAAPPPPAAGAAVT
ncbi:winged helix-turn-helix domain-containing protein [Hyphobacterium marinum]|uniref:Winged helix-turn-helix domain-containing protein n=1 Tax=Hyphobacterium marinum TaxID=3116574 RepID=A0ABU7LX44_9PROT|nr:winged helix-turn-helix domain-containing protein [Hyphobacterium sp. Y6023]MEE2566136.1 winged helix-turn-helix domain-containing protein [Hyphobacterium sp. Y6023]